MPPIVNAERVRDLVETKYSLHLICVAGIIDIVLRCNLLPGAEVRQSDLISSGAAARAELAVELNEAIETRSRGSRKRSGATSAATGHQRVSAFKIKLIAVGVKTAAALELHLNPLITLEITNRWSSVGCGRSSEKQQEERSLHGATRHKITDPPQAGSLHRFVRRCVALRRGQAIEEACR